MAARHRHSMRRHFERQHSALKEEWDKPGFVNQLAGKVPSITVDSTVNETSQNKFLQVRYDSQDTSNNKNFGETDNAQGMYINA